uniref:Ras-associating domain-containing protein n=1 Tax=Syphacia muris TaxID=451379 RepID=A0A0N5AUJ1_9BILA
MKQKAKNGEIRIVFFGIDFKSILFEKLAEAATKVERHITYEDTYYLKFSIDDDEVTVELVDPGLEHTGAREMAIRKADGAVLFYSAYSASSYHKLAELLTEFNKRQTESALPSLLFSSEDDYFDDDIFECLSNDQSSSSTSSASEGYESEISTSKTSQFLHRNVSMKKMRTCDEEKIPEEQGQQLAQLFGSECKFISTRIAAFTGTKLLIEELLRKIRSQQNHRTRFLARTRPASFPKENKHSVTKDCKKSIDDGRSLSVKERMLHSNVSEKVTKSKRSVKQNSTPACVIS